MRFLLLATDYDGTLAHDGYVDDATIAALDRVRASGRKLVLVTGRHLPDLCKIFPKLHLFDRVIVENGGLLYRPQTREEKPLCEPPAQPFVSLLREKRVPFALGRTVVATWKPHEEAVLSAIRDSGLDLQVIFNKDAVMVLPSGVNKGTGLQFALDELGLSPHNVVSIGDAENDHPFLAMSECAVAVANAIPSLKERADVVTDAARGAGVMEIAGQLVKDDLVQVEPKLARHAISLGHRIKDSSQPVLVSPHGGSILIAGPSGSGKSTAVSGIVEQLGEHRYQFCLVDPEGDYENLTGALSFGSAKSRPDVKAILRALESSGQSVVVNLLGVSVEERPGFFSSLLPHIQDLRSRTARPHWLVIDEAHHLLPSSWSPATTTVPQILETTILITVHPEHVAKAALNLVDVLVAIGKSPMHSFSSFANVVQVAPPQGDDIELKTGEALVWFRKQSEPPIHVKTIRGTGERRRHLRQYAEGELTPEQSFYFRGPDSKLNLRAQNLNTFIQLAEGVDDVTWMHHLRRGDYSFWFESIIKDSELAREVAAVEQNKDASPRESRKKIKQTIESRYTVPA